MEIVPTVNGDAAQSILWKLRRTAPAESFLWIALAFAGE